MSAQTEMFPKTELDQAHAILNHLLNEREKASQAIDNAEKKHADCSDRVYKQQRVIEWLQAKMPAADATLESEATEEPVEEAEIVDESHQIEGDVIDPITGEVTGKEERGEGTVRVWWPHDEEPGLTEIGEHTQYAELVADYVAAGDPDMPSDDIEDYCVVGIGDGHTRPLHNVIVPEDHGLEFAVVYGTAANFKEDLRECTNCGVVDGCAVAPRDLQSGALNRDAAMGCGGSGWRPVPTDEELGEHEANMAQESAA